MGLGLLLAVIAFQSCSDDRGAKPKTMSDKVEKGAPDQISINPEVVFVDSSFTKAVLNAGRARIYQQRMETWLDGGLKLDFFSKKSGSRMSHLVADSAKIDDKTRDMFAFGNVVVVSDSTGSRLETQVLEWNNRTQRLYSNEFVRINTPNETIEGYGFESDPSLKNYRISRVSGVKR